MRGDSKRGLIRLSVTLLLWVVPTLPCHVGLVLIAFPNSWVLLGGLFVLCAVFAACHLAESGARAPRVAFVVMVLWAWLPVLAVAAWLRRFFPGIELAFPIVTLSLLISGRLAHGGARLAIDGAICLCVFAVAHVHFRELSWGLIGGIAALLAVALALHRLSEVERASRAPRWLHLAMVTGLGAIGSLGLHAYVASHADAAREIAAQPGVRRLASSDRNDINFFIDDGEGNGWRFYHHNADFCAYRRGIPDTCRQEGWRPSDEAVRDVGASAYWFFSGPNLWRMAPGDSEPSRIASFDEEFRRVNPVFPGGNIRGFPVDRPTRFLAQYDEASGVVVFDATQGSARVVTVGNRNTDSIWAPDGRSIVVLGSNKASLRPLRGKLTKMDLEGRVLHERYIDDVVSYLTQTDRPYFFVSSYSRHRVERVSYETLETIEAVRTDRYPRSSWFDSARAVLIVPSFLDGTLSFYRPEGLAFVAKIRIGTRVRAVTPSLIGDEVLIASSAGQFAVNVDEVLRSRGAETSL